MDLPLILVSMRHAITLPGLEYNPFAPKILFIISIQGIPIGYIYFPVARANECAATAAPPRNWCASSTRH